MDTYCEEFQRHIEVAAMRYHLFRKGLRYLHLEVPKLNFLFRWAWKDPLPRYSRVFLVLALGRFSAMLQLYRPGGFLPRHEDGPKSCPTLAVELWSPREGRLECYGRHLRMGDLVFFNGADLHEVTECSGYRLSLLFQFVARQ